MSNDEASKAVRPKAGQNSQDASSSLTAASQEEQALDTAAMFNHLMREIKQLKEGMQNMDIDGEIESLLEQEVDANGALDNAIEEGEIREDLADNESLDARVSKLTEPKSTSDVLTDIALDLKINEPTGEPVDEGLAGIVQSLLKEKLPEEKFQKKIGQYPRPQNVENLKTPRVNPLIWSQLSAQIRTHDSKSQKIQSALVGSIAATIKATDLALKQQQPDKEIVTALTDSVALALQSFHDMNVTRRLAMKNDLHQDYASLCSSTTLEAPSEYLFGDLSKLTRDIADANKLAKRVRRGSRGRQQSNRSNYNASGQRYSPYSSGNRRFPAANQRGIGDFLSRGHYPKTKMKRAAKQN